MTGPGWDGVAPELRAIIERVCTPAQIEVMKAKASLPSHNIEGASARQIARHLRKDESTVRHHLAAAAQRIRAEVAAQRGIA